MAKNVNAIGRGKNVHLGEFMTEERVEQRGFSRFYFADDDKEQGLPNIGEQAVNGIEDG